MAFFPIVTEYREGEGWFISDAVRCASLSVGFKEAGDVLVEQGIESDMENYFVAPASYLYRHAIELILKQRLNIYLWLFGRLSG